MDPTISIILSDDDDVHRVCGLQYSTVPQG